MLSIEGSFLYFLKIAEILHLCPIGDMLWNEGRKMHFPFVDDKNRDLHYTALQDLVDACLESFKTILT